MLMFYTEPPAVSQQDYVDALELATTAIEEDRGRNSER